MERPSQILPQVPWAWYHFCSLDELKKKPVGLTLGGKRYVGFSNGAGQVSVLSGRCGHMGADLSLGCVVDGRLQCPFHGWAYGADGVCGHIPAQKEIPGTARQQAYPVKVMGGQVFFYNHVEAAFEAPFFEGVTPEELVPARYFELDAVMPWYMVGSNGFDLQHYRWSHDRELVNEPVMSTPAAHAARFEGQFAVTGKGPGDRVTRALAGPEVRMHVTSWVGVMILVMARFKRTTSFGMVTVFPKTPQTCVLRVTVWVKRSEGLGAWAGVNSLNAWMRARFVREFLRGDQQTAVGTDFNPASALESDGMIAAYLSWLGRRVNGEGFTA